jgi:hypothetical protein
MQSRTRWIGKPSGRLPICPPLVYAIENSLQNGKFITKWVFLIFSGQVDPNAESWWAD